MLAVYAPIVRARRFERVPWCTLFSFVLLGSFALAQFTWAPALLPALQRAPTLEPWRLLSSVLVQDGGVEGTLSNLLALLVIGALAEQWWTRSAWAALSVTGVLAGNVAGVWLQPYGAGNSTLVFALSASLAVLRPCWPALAADVVLIARGDIHGFAALPGALLAWRLRPRALP